MTRAFLILSLTLTVLAACSKEVPCTICYEDEWSREPFPGQQKQHMGTLSPEDLKATGGRPSKSMAAEFLGVVSPTAVDGTRW